MNKLTILIILMFVFTTSFSQTSILFTENFETGSAPDSVTFAGNALHGKSSALFSSGLHSDSLRLAVAGDSIVMKTFSFSTSGYPFLYLRFDHICKIEFFDYATIEVSNNNGSSWTQLGSNQYVGNGLFTNFGNRFNSASYPNDWWPGTWVIPQNNWWKTETFDISSVAGNAANVLVRFSLKDANNSGQQNDNYAWFLDNINVSGSAYEFYPPNISMITPLQDDSITTNTAYLIKAKITDASNIDTAYLVYSVNNYVHDTLGMTKTNGDTFQAFIPFYGYGRTILFNIYAKDLSPNHNVAVYPTNSNRKIYAKYTTDFVYTFSGTEMTSQSYGPIYRNDASGTFNWSLYAYMLRKNELMAAGVPTNGKIKRIEWYKSNGNYTNGNAIFNIFLKNSTQRIYPTGISTLSWDTILQNSTQVYSSTTQQIDNRIGWYPFNITPYTYTGNDIEIGTQWDISMVTNPKASGQITWNYIGGFAETMTLGNGATSAPSIVASFSYGGAVRPVVRITVETPYNLSNDAGITQITNPLSSVTANASFGVYARLKNFGINTLTSASIQWSVDDVVQSAYSFTGSMAHDSVSSPLLLGNLSLNTGVHRIKVWTVLPNGVSDANIANDTAYITFMACNGTLSGNYSIHPVSGDFKSISDAALALSQCGVSGPVTMNIAAGIYNEQIMIPAIPGANATNTVTFTSTSTDSNAVKIQFQANANANYDLCLNGAKYLKFKYLNFTALDGLYARLVEIKNHSSNISIENCVFNGVSVNIIDVDKQSMIYALANGIDSGFTLKNSRFENGYNALILSGINVDTLLSNVLITKNLFVNQYLLAADLNAIQSPVFSHNIIQTINPSIASQGINLRNLKGKWIFSHNTLNLLNGARAVSIWNCNSSYNNDALFINNMISQGGSYATNLIDFNNGTGIRFYNNSFHKYSTTTANVFNLNTYPSSDRTDSIYIYNNIFVSSTAVGQLINIPVAIGTRKIQFNNNDYFTLSTNFASNGTNTVTSFSAWKTLINQDLNSINVDPNFASAGNLHITNYALKGQGATNTFVNDDIDGKVRTTYPTIGAHELLDLTHDINMVQMISPVSGCGLSSTETVKVLLINNGLNAITTPFTLNYTKTGSGNVQTETINQSMAVGDTLIYSFANKVNLSTYGNQYDTSYTIKVWANYSLDQFVFNDSLSKNISSGYKQNAPTAGTFNTNYGTSAVLTATGADTLFYWRSTDTASLFMYFGSHFTTPILLDTSVFYVSTKLLSGMQCESQRTPVTVNVINFPANDAGITAITQPTGILLSKTDEILKVKVKNYGLQNLSSVKIKYSLNGILKDSVSWTGSILNGNETVVNLDTLNLDPGTYQLKVWTSMPNNVTDAYFANDTISMTLLSRMHGNYTIGKAGGSQSYDFNTFTSAVAVLCGAGISGNVSFSVDTGVYNEKFIIYKVPGAGPSARVTFISMNGDSSSVKIAGILSTDSAVVTLRGTGYLNFKKLSFSSLGTTGTQGRAVMMDYNTNNILFENNYFEGVNTGGSGNGLAVLYAYNNACSNITIRNNRFKNGTEGIYLYAKSTEYASGNYILNNIITHFTFASMIVGYQDSVQVIGNRINKLTTVGNSQGLSMSSCTNGTNVSYNYIDNTGSSYGTGIQFQNVNGTANARCILSNNFIIGNAGSTISQGLNLLTSSNVDIYYNSVNMAGSGAFGRGATFNGCTSLNFKNNILYSPSTYVLYFSGTNTFLSSDYNCFYTGGSTFSYIGTDQLNFNAYKSTSGRDAHSVNLLPAFTSATDLHLLNSVLSGLATPINGYTTDFDGQNRSIYPTIGADEYPLAQKDAAIHAVLVPGTLHTEGDTIYPKIILRNAGSDTLTSVPVQYTINNGTPKNSTINCSLALFETDTFVLPYFVSPAGNYQFCVKTLLNGDTIALNDQICRNVYGNPLKDAYLQSIIAMKQGCNLGSDTIKIYIKNMGQTAINGNLSAYYKINNGPTISQTVSQQIAVGDSVLFKFSQLVNLAVSTNDSIFGIKSWIQLLGDNVSYNDSGYTKVYSLYAPPAPVPTNASIAYANTATVQVTTVPNTQVLWYNNPIGGQIIHQNTVYTTPVLYQNDTLYAESKRGAYITDTIQIGYGILKNIATNWPSPYGNYQYGNKEQYLITADELKAMGAKAGLITKLAFNVDTINACPALYNYQIKMSHTQKTSMTGWIPGILTSVYSVGLYQPYDGWNVHEFQQAFDWNGVDNVVVEVCFNNATSVTNGNASVFYSATPVNTVARYAGNYSSVCSAPGSYTLGANRPNIRFEMAIEGCPSPRVPVYISVSAQPSHDVGISRIQNPVSAVGLSNHDTVKVWVKNYGAQAQTGIPVKLKLNNLNPITETIANNILSGDSLLYTFVSTLDLSSEYSQNIISVYTELSGDTLHANDTARTMITHLPSGYCTSTATDATNVDITDVTIGSFSNYSAPTGCKYTNFCTTVAAPSFTIGTNYPVSITSTIPPGGASTVYAWVKIWVDLDHDKTFSASELLFSSTTYTANTVTGNLVIPSGAVYGNTMMRVVLVRYGSASSVTACGTYQYGETEDYIVKIVNQYGCDAGATAILQPGNAQMQGTSSPVWVKIYNFGSDTIFPGNLNVSYTLNGNNPVTVQYTDTLAPLTYDSVLMPQLILPFGDNNLCAYTTMSCDSVPSNNQICKNVFGETILSLPYFDTFDTTNYWHTSNPNLWERGIPNGTTINSPQSIPNVWMTLLNADYPHNAGDYLYSSYFDFSPFSATDTIVLKFWMSINSESGFDGSHLQFSKNGGTSWNNIGYMFDPAGTNWYNTNVGGVHCWTGNINWTEVSYKLDPSIFNQNTPVQFRFRFFSNSSVAYDGMAIDNFSLISPIPAVNAGVTSIEMPANNVHIADTFAVKVRFKNFGTDTLHTIPLQYTVNSVVKASETWSGNLYPGLDTTYVFTQKHIAGPNDTLICSYTQIIGDFSTSNDTACTTLSILPAAYDASVIQILSPIGSASTISPNTVIIRIKNYGSTTLTSIPVSYKRGATVMANEVWTGNLVAGATVDYTFTATFVALAGNFQLCTRTSLSNDVYTANDEKCMAILGTSIETTEENGFYLNQNNPNPVVDKTVIGFNLPAEGEVKLRILNTLGEEVQSFRFLGNTGKNDFDLDLSNYPSGVYFYLVEYNNIQKIKKLTIVK